LNIQTRTTREFTSEDRELLTAIGNQIGIAIANAALIEEAEQRRATLDGVVTSLVDGLILVDRWGKIAYANPRAEEMLALPGDGLAGQTLEALERDLSSRLALSEERGTTLQLVIADLETPIVEFTLSAPEATTVQARAFPIREAGGDEQGVGVLLRDVTREKELDLIKSQLLATVSHELRTPLASIKGFATTLLRRDVDWDQASRREFLHIIDEESDRLSELISNLLDMSRVEAGTLGIEPELIDLQPIIHETAEEFQVMTRDHEFQTQVPPCLPPVYADPRRARQVLRNLVENAVKYSPEGGPITIDVREMPDSLRISVSDQGLGIEPHDAERIFDRFYQVDSASTRRVGGSGLGLSICKAIVEAHGGRIWVESQPGTGSTFCFTLPLQEA
jgi:signal transduction histidine kinase